MSCYERIKQVAIDEGFINTQASHRLLKLAENFDLNVAEFAEQITRKEQDLEFYRRENLKLKEQLIMAKTQPYLF